MKWMITEDKLGADQVEVINEIGKITARPIWIKGHAGSGKSVLLLHSLADYVTKNPNSSVCVVVFTRALVDLLETGLKQIPKLSSKKIPVLTIYQLKYKIDNGPIRYNAIFCDEVQDLPVEFVASMKAACNHLVIAGDAEQSIYNSVPVWNLPPATQSEIQSILSPLEKKLGVIYRLTESVLGILKKVFRSMLSDMPNIAKSDTEINLYQFDSGSHEDEIKFCWTEIKRTNALRATEVSAILLFGHEAIIEFINSVLTLEGKKKWPRVNGKDNRPDYENLNQYLRSCGVPLMYVGNSYGSLTVADNENKIIIMTYHSAKGLDFDYVYLPMVNEDMYIHSNENALLLVALSRSKSGLFISYTGSLYPNLRKFLSDIRVKKIDSAASDEILF